MRQKWVWVCLLLASWLVLGPAAADDWTVTQKDGRFFATLPEYPDQVFPLKSFGGKTPKPGSSSREVPRVHPHLLLVTYYAGETGSDRIVSHYRALIIDKKTAKLLGDLPSSYIVSTTPRARQPRWKWTSDQLTMVDGEFDQQITIALR